MTIDETIGAQVHAAMWRARVSQVQLAGALGLDQAAVSRRLRGRTPWKASEVLSAAALLGVSITDLYPSAPELEPAPAKAVGQRDIPGGMRSPWSRRIVDMRPPAESGRPLARPLTLLPAAS